MAKKNSQKRLQHKKCCLLRVEDIQLSELESIVTKQPNNVHSRLCGKFVIKLYCTYIKIRLSEKNLITVHLITNSFTRKLICINAHRFNYFDF